jgi:predicted dehydrogenase
MDFVPYDRPLRVGVLGLGRVYDLTITGYRDNTDAEIVALCDSDTAKLDERSAEWPDASRHTDIDDFLAQDMDVVEVLTPTPTHAEIVEQILDAGFHVNVQKPMARSLAEADRMLDAAKRNQRVLRVMENFLFYEPLQRLKDIVDTGAIGEPAGFHMKMIATGNGGWDVPWESYRWQFEQALDGTGILMFDDGWHKFSVARWLFGPVDEVMAWVGRTEVVPGMIVIDAPSSVMWRHASGVQGTWDITFAPDMLMKSRYYSNDERFEVVGRRGWARVNQCTARGMHIPSLETYVDGITEGHHDLDDDWASSFRDQTRHFLRVMRTGEGELLWSGDAAREVLAFNLAALESSRRNEPVRLAEFG